MADIPTRWLALLALVALVPVLVFLADRRNPVVALAVVNVCLLAVALYTFLGPASDEASAN